MPVFELHVDTTTQANTSTTATTAATTTTTTAAAAPDVTVSSSAYPPGTLRGDVLAIRPAHVGKGKAKDRPLLYKVDSVPQDGQSGEDGSSGAAKRRNKAHVIVSATVAQNFSWIKTRQDVFITLVHSPPPTELTASFVELYFKDLYLSRPDMLRLSLSLVDSCLFINQRVVLPGGSQARLRVGGIFNQEGHTVRSAYVDDETKIVFRSESARCYVFVEVSQEMWTFEEDGSMLREKCQVFLHELFAHWTGRMGKGNIDVKSKGNPTSHTVSIILYGRVLYEDNGEGEEARAPLRRLEDGTLYRDFYKVILDLTPSPSPSIVRTVAAEIRSWQESVLTRHRPNGELKLAGRLAFAHESPVLEATNLALNSFEEHWVDRDLQRTGLEIIVLTAGTSFYQVPKGLLRLTTERMLYHGVGLDLISLSKTPLHTVPLFSFRSYEPGLSETATINAAAGIQRQALSSTNANALGLIDATREPGVTSPTSAAHTSSSLHHAPPPAPSTHASSSTTAAGDTSISPAVAATSHPAPSLPDDQRDPLYYDPPPATAPASSSNSNSTPAPQPLPATSIYYAEPMFIFCSFFGTQIDKPHRVDRFMPRARCYQLFSQGSGERKPFAIPLLLPTSSSSSAAAAGAVEGRTGQGAHVNVNGNNAEDEENWSFLSEMEKRQRRRDRHDAVAVGARGTEESAVWRRLGLSGVSGMSGATGGTAASFGAMSGSSWDAAAEQVGHGREGAPVMPLPLPLPLRSDSDRDTEAEGEAQIEDELTRRTTALGNVVGAGGKRRMARTVSEAVVSGRQERERERGRGGREERLGERGAALAPAARRAASVAATPTTTRSRTPAPATATTTATTAARRARSTSIAASLRSVASSTKTQSESIKTGPSTKSATPALIARLTSQAADTGTSSSTFSKPQSNNRPGGWLGLFSNSRGHATTAAAPAPSVAVQKVEAQANVKAELDLDGRTTTVLSSRHSQSSRDTSPASTSRQSLHSARPTQPISISTRAEQTREADRPSSRARYGSLKMKPVATTTAGAAAAAGQQQQQQSGGYTSTSRRSGGGSKAFTMSRFNPSKPGKQSLGLADQARRWASIFIRHSNDQRSVNWVSVTRGACLPLTTDYLPTADSLNSHYSEYRYSVPVSKASSSFLLRTDNPDRSPVLELVTELVSQRLSHGFQLVTPANHVGALDEVNMASSKTLSDVLHDVQEGESTALYLTLSNQIHRLAYDRRTQSVLVKIMRRRRSWIKEEYDYGALIFSQSSHVYSQLSLRFPYPNMIEPGDWQHLDRLVAGVERLDLRPTLRYWRTRLVLLPASSIPDREYIISRSKALSVDGEPTDSMIQDQGFHTFMEIIETARWSEPGTTKEQIPITHTSLSAPEWAVSIARDASSATTAVAGMSSAPIVPQPRVATSWLSRIKITDSQPPTPAVEMTQPVPSLDNAAPSSSSAAKLPTVQMSYAVMLDLDPHKRSPRSERVLCHLDRSHNTQAAYHLELNWLAGSGKIIDQAIQNWTRQVARFGLNLVEVSVRAVEDRHNPFQKSNQVRLALPPPSVDDFEPALAQDHFESGLLRSLDYFLDVGADTTFPDNVDVQYSYRRTPTTHSQYIHRSGTLLVAILGGQDGFVFIPNRIFTSHTTGGTRPEEPMAELIGLCGDSTALGKLWVSLSPKKGEDSDLGS